MGHIVLIGDSIFDNARYVPDRPPVIEQLRKSLPSSWTASLLAIDGHTTAEVPRQLTRLPDSATHLFLSIGGNDALGASGLVRESVSSVAEALVLLNEAHVRFRQDYHEMLRKVLATEKPAAVCTIYDSVPGLPQEELTALAVFNEVILRSAFMAQIPVIDLRLLCGDAADYSPVSPIEPSVIGGAKIARVIAHVATRHDFSRAESVVYY